MNDENTVKTENLKANLVIIGGGGAGLAAAIAAAENGCPNVILLEKGGSPGGSSAMAHDVFGAESPVQKRLGHDARRDDFFRIAMNWAHWSKVNPRIVRAFIDKSGDTIRWLEEKGVVFELTQFYPNQVPRVRHTVHGPGEAAEMIRILRKNCQDLGVQIFTRTRGQKILRGGDGNVTAVMATTSDGELMITTRSVIITSGGYGNNKELLKKYCPSYYHIENMEYDGVRSNTGDGLLMAIEAGAATAGLGTVNFRGPATPRATSEKITIGSGEGAMQMRLATLVWEPQTLWVNKRGKRFIDEGHNLSPFACGNAIAQQPDNVMYTLFDSNILRSMEEQGLIRPGAFGGQTQRNPLRRMPMAGEPVPGLAKGLREHAEKGNDYLKIADTLDEMAGWIGAKPAVLKDTIDEYNTACDQGYDDIFVKDRSYLLPLREPPYYAIKGHSFICDAIGGIKINENMEVLDQEDESIPGLYAAGVCTGCWESESYCYHLTGHLLGFALNSGRIAGESAAAYVSG